MFGQFGRMFLKFGKIIKGISTGQIAGVDQAHNVSPVLTYEEMRKEYAIPFMGYLLDRLSEPEFQGIISKSSVEMSREELTEKANIPSNRLMRRIKGAKTKVRIFKTNSELGDFKSSLLIFPVIRGLIADEATCEILEEIRKDLDFNPSLSSNMDNHSLHIEAHTISTGAIGGQIGNVDISYKASTIIKNDFESLAHFLKEIKVPDSDINSLKGAVKKDLKVNNEQPTLGENISSWIGKMVEKSVLKIWDFAEDKAVNVLKSSILKFLGIPF